MHSQEEGEELKRVCHPLDVLLMHLPLVVDEEAGVRVKQLICLAMLVSFEQIEALF